MRLYRGNGKDNGKYYIWGYIGFRGLLSESSYIT